MNSDGYNLVDHCALSFILGEYLGLQSQRLDKESNQVLNDKVGRILKKLNTVAYLTEKENSST